MPLAQADANSGVIISDWYANPAAPTERVKVTVSILDKDLRADALRVAASRQVYSNGQWLDAELRAGTVQRLEEAILAKARDLRRAAPCQSTSQEQSLERPFQSQGFRRPMAARVGRKPDRKSTRLNSRQ